jgi:hypothetical protein
MELFEHVRHIYSEMNDDIELDLPQALFMIKLLAIKGSVPVSKKDWEIYMKSDKPLRLRYYLQIKFPEELKKSCDEATQEMNRENGYVEECFGDGLSSDVIAHDKRIELYEKYFKDKIFDEYNEYIQKNISEWIKPDLRNGGLNYEIKRVINIIISKYWGHPENIKQNMIKFMKRFKDRESVHKLLNSMRDVYTLRLV